MTILWNEVLQDALSSDVQGSDCVLQSDSEIYTFTIVDGIAHFVGEGDLHEQQYERFRRSVALTPHEYCSNLSANYTLTLYPSNIF